MFFLLTASCVPLVKIGTLGLKIEKQHQEKEFLYKSCQTCWIDNRTLVKECITVDNFYMYCSAPVDRQWQLDDNCQKAPIYFHYNVCERIKNEY